jgi:hypothetical protein
MPPNPKAPKRQRIAVNDGMFVCLVTDCCFRGDSMTELSLHAQTMHDKDELLEDGERTVADMLILPPMGERVRGRRYLCENGIRFAQKDRLSKSCVFCPTSPSYGEKGGKPTHCAGCAKDKGLVNVKSKMCIECGEIIPSFGKKGGKKATHCAECAKGKYLVDVTHKMCVKCHETYPSYGEKGGKPTHCAECAKGKDLVNVKDKMCAECGEVHPCFGKKGGKPTHCAKCAKGKDLVNVKEKMCVQCNEIRSYFGEKGGKPTHCAECAKGKDLVNVIHKMCVECNEIHPSYGKKGGKPTHCAECAKGKDLVNVKDKMCVGCGVISAGYGFVHGAPTHCNGCREEGMSFARKRKVCSTETHGINDRIIACYTHPETEEPLCTFCHHVLFPDLGQTKVKQEDWIIEGLRHRLLELEPYMVVRDCVIPGACSLLRPDVLYMFDSAGAPFALSIECDEKGSCHEDSMERLREIQRGHGCQAFVVLRINPNQKRKRKMLKQFEYANGNKYYAPTMHFDTLMDEVEEVIRKHVVYALDHKTVPDICLRSAKGLAKIKMFF